MAKVEFETLNYRGVELGALDLVKNYLLGKTGSAARLREVQMRWAQMIANLANVRGEDFLKVWWTSRYGRIQKAQLFPSFKAKVPSWRQVSETSVDLLNASEQYAALEIADDPIWAGISERSRQRIRALKLLGSRQTHPVLLSALPRFSQRELERLLHLLEVLIVRYQLIGGGRTGRLEISCAALAAGIFQEKIKTATEAFQALKDIFPTDGEFREAFRVKQEKNNQKARYVLKTLETQAQQSLGLGMEAAEFEPSVSLTVEHILPVSPEAAWDPLLQQDPSLAEDCTYRLGNLCLLTKVNKELGGNPSTRSERSLYSPRWCSRNNWLIMRSGTASRLISGKQAWRSLRSLRGGFSDAVCEGSANECVGQCHIMSKPPYTHTGEIRVAHCPTLVRRTLPVSQQWQLPNSYAAFW